MRPYSMDLRQPVAAAVDHGEGSLRLSAHRFRVSPSFLARLLRRRRRTGPWDPKPHGGGPPPALDHAGRHRLHAPVRLQPDATLDELRQRRGVPRGRMALWRALWQQKLTPKEESLHAQERDTPEGQQKRRASRATVSVLDPHRLVSVDETGTNTAMARTYGRAPQGERAVGTGRGRWKSVTLISAPRLSGVVAPWAFEGVTDTPAFQTYVEQAVASQLRPGDVVIWDNLTPHQEAYVKQVIEQAEAELVPLPPYSSDLTPIEERWSKAKTFLRSVAARTGETLYDAMGAAWGSVRPEDILGWFRSCGWCGEPGLKSPDPVHSTTCGVDSRCSRCATQ